MRPAALVHNPIAGSGRHRRVVARIGQILERGGFDLEPLATTRPGEATELARRAAGSGAEVVFAYGGDGTLREAAAGLLGTGVPLGFLPAGTANVMALALGLPASPLAAAAALCLARPAEIDVGLAGGDPFLMQASCGLDARVMDRVRPGLKRRLGRLGVGLTALAEWRTYDFPEFRLTADGESTAAVFAAVCNIPFYGGTWRLVPEARPDDGRLDLLVFRGRGRRAAAALARDLFLGRRHLARDDVEVRRVERVRIEGPPELPIQLDGDPRRGGPPLEITLAPSRLRVLRLPPRPGDPRGAARPGTA